MSDIKNLNQSEAVQKIRDLAEDIKICMLCTSSQREYMHTRPMNTQKVADDGTIYFFSPLSSHTTDEILHDQEVQLIYSDPAKNHFLSLYGRAKVVKDQALVDELWDPTLKTWFPQGKNDPQITIIKVKPENGYYWDTKNGKIISMIKIAVGAITGKTMDGTVEGKVSFRSN